MRKTQIDLHTFIFNLRFIVWWNIMKLWTATFDRVGSAWLRWLLSFAAHLLHLPSFHFIYYFSLLLLMLCWNAPNLHWIGITVCARFCRHVNCILGDSIQWTFDVTIEHSCFTYICIFGPLNFSRTIVNPIYVYFYILAKKWKKNRTKLFLHVCVDEVGKKNHGVLSLSIYTKFSTLYEQWTFKRSMKNEYKISCVESAAYQLVEGFKRTKISSTNCQVAENLHKNHTFLCVCVCVAAVQWRKEKKECHRRACT